MSKTNILNLPVAIALDGTEYVPLMQAGTAKRATTALIANQASGFIPDSAAITAGSGLGGGGLVISNPSLFLNIDNLPTNSAMVVADSFAINLASGTVSQKVTFPNAMKALTGLPVLSIPSLTDDFLIINRAADGSTYKISPSSLALAAGNVPAGGLTGQFLAKLSNADYDTAWESPSILLDPFTVAANPTGVTDLGVSVGLGATLAFAAGPIIQTGAGTGDVTWAANAFLTTIANNAVTNAKFRQSAALSVVGNATNATANVADIAAGTDHNILRRSGTAIGFGSIDLSQTGAVGASILGVSNGGTGAATLTGLVQGHGTAAFTAITDSSTVGQVLQVTGPSTYAWAALSGGDVTGAALTRVDDTNVTITLGGTPATALLRATSLTVGWTGLLAVARGGTGAASQTAYAVLCGGTTSTGPYQSIASVGTTNQILASNGPGALPSFKDATSALGAALTRVDDTNVTLTLGGAPTTALLSATSLTLGWTGQLSLARGGTNASLTASNGGIFYSTATAGAILAGTATANQIVLSGANAAPSWSTATYPATTTINQLLYSSAANVISGLATVNGGLLNAGATGIPALTVTPILGVAGASTGTLSFSGATSGVVTIQPQAAAGTWNFNLPTTAGSPGQVLTSGGGAGTAMTWETVAGTGTVTSVDVSGGTTGLTTTGGPVTTSGTITLQGTLVVANGGTGLTSLTSNVIYKGAGTSPLATSSITDDGTRVTVTGEPVVAPVFAPGYTTTATAAGTTTLTVTSTRFQFFTGSTTQNCDLPVTSTLTTGHLYTVVNNSTGVVTVRSSGANTVLVMGPSSTATFICILTSGTTAASWQVNTTYANIPQNSQSAAYTTTLSDAGKHILHPTADNNPRTFTIDSNANVPYPIGTSITFVNQINTLTIAITSDTLTQAGTGSTGSRTLSAAGIATALKLTSTSWIISGVGLT